MMKKLCALALALLLTMSLAACGSGGNESKPETVVTEFCEAVKTLDGEKANACLATPLPEDFFSEDATLPEDVPGAQEMADQFNAWAAQMTYTLGEATVDGETATVPVHITYVNAADVFTEALSEYFLQAFGLALTGADEEQLSQLMMDLLKEKMETVSTSTGEADLTFTCQQTDGKWKIAALSDDQLTSLTRILSCGILDIIQELEEAFGT